MMVSYLMILSWLAAASRFRVLWSIITPACMSASSLITILKQCYSLTSQLTLMLLSLVGETVCKYFFNDYTMNCPLYI